MVPQRRGLRRYRLIADRKQRRNARIYKGPDIVHWMLGKLEAIVGLSSRQDNLAVSVADFQTASHPVSDPHQVFVTLPVSYLDEKKANRLEENIKALLGRTEISWTLEVISDRPPMTKRPKSNGLIKELQDTGRRWEMGINAVSSLYPSAAGLVPKPVAVACGMGAVYRDLYTPQEAVQRISLVQRTLLLAQFLVRELEKLPAPPEKRRASSKRTKR